MPSTSSGGGSVSSISMVALGLLVLLGLGIFGWTSFVDLKPPRTVRNWMLSMLAFITLFEVYLYITGLASCRWFNFLAVTFVCNFWGLLDVLRTFPRIRDLDSWQSAKLTILLMLKTFVYCLCLAYHPYNAVLFMVTTFTNVWLLPIMYLVALPHGYEVSEGPRLDDPYTEDIAVSLWRLVNNRCAREEAWQIMYECVAKEGTTLMRLFPLPWQRWLSQRSGYIDLKLSVDRRGSGNDISRVDSNNDEGGFDDITDIMEPWTITHKRLADRSLYERQNKWAAEGFDLLRPKHTDVVSGELVGEICVVVTKTREVASLGSIRDGLQTGYPTKWCGNEVVMW